MKLFNAIFISCCLAEIVTIPVLNSFYKPSHTLESLDYSHEDKPDVKGLLGLTKDLVKPSENDKNIAMLMQQLGGEYNSDYTSIVEPDALKAYEPSIVTATEHVHNPLKNHPQMPEELKRMKFIIKRTNGKRKELGKRSTEKFQKWLWSLSRCPVRYRWLDLGENVFPRYVKRGTCSKKKTCSYPAGMKCKKSEWKELTILLYTCRKGFASTCKWIPMSIYVLSKCSCGCHK